LSRARIRSEERVLPLNKLPRLFSRTANPDTSDPRGLSLPSVHSAGNLRQILAETVAVIVQSPIRSARRCFTMGQICNVTLAPRSLAMGPRSVGSDRCKRADYSDHIFGKRSETIWAE